MEHNQTDSDAGGQSSVGVGRVEDLKRLLHEVQPNWIADGYGLRGPQEARQREVAATPIPMEFGLPSGDKAGFGESNNDCNPPNNTDVFVRGAIAGVCQWIPICEATCPP